MRYVVLFNDDISSQGSANGNRQYADLAKGKPKGTGSVWCRVDYLIFFPSVGIIVSPCVFPEARWVGGRRPT